MLTVRVTIGFTLSERRAVNVAVPLNPACSVTLYVTFAVPCPALTTTDEMPVTATADQLKMLLSSEPLRPTVNGAASCATVAIGFAGAVIVGGLLTTVGVTAMLTARVTGAFTLSVSDAVNVAVPLNPDCSVTLYVTFAVPCPALTTTDEMPVPAVADQLKTLLSSVPLRPTVNGAAS